MRILVHEFVSGGGLAGRDVPASLGREASAMLTALVSDLAAIRCHEIVTTADARFPHAMPPGVEVVTLPTSRKVRESMLDGLMASADAVWLVAPETDPDLLPVPPSFDCRRARVEDNLIDRNRDSDVRIELGRCRRHSRRAYAVWNGVVLRWTPRRRRSWSAALGVRPRRGLTPKYATSTLLRRRRPPISPG